MKDSLKSGLTFEFKYLIPASKTVPYLYPEAPEFQQMPHVLATGFMVGLIEWACVDFINRYLDWPAEDRDLNNFPIWDSGVVPLR